MKSIVLFFCLLSGHLMSQSIYEGFDNVVTLYSSSGWFALNRSNPNNGNIWNQDSGNFTALSGSSNSSITTGWYCTTNTGTGDASNWLFTPPLNLYNGDTVSFYTISYNNTFYADRLELRANIISTDTFVGNNDTTVGNYGVLLLTVNPALDHVTYPMAWTKFTVVLSGVPGGMGRLAFRYLVPQTGGTGINGSVIGLDDFEFSPGLLSIQHVNESEELNFFPNPVENMLTISTSRSSIQELNIYASNGQLVYFGKMTGEKTIVNVSEFRHGIYFLEARSPEGVIRKIFVK